MTLATKRTPTDKTAIQRQIDPTDRQIDQLVYKLYGLTDDEIRTMLRKYEIEFDERYMWDQATTPIGVGFFCGDQPRVVRYGGQPRALSRGPLEARG